MNNYEVSVGKLAQYHEQSHESNPSQHFLHYRCNVTDETKGLVSGEVYALRRNRCVDGQ